MTFVLDTHAWVWWHLRPTALSRKALGLLSDPGGYDALLWSAISVWEFFKLFEKGRIGLSCGPEEWVRDALQMPKLTLAPLTPGIAYRSTTLPPPFHTDPADQIIVATAREEKAAVITKDKRIRDYPHVRTYW